jgi:hypothetical protein
MLFLQLVRFKIQVFNSLSIRQKCNLMSHKDRSLRFGNKTKRLGCKRGHVQWRFWRFGPQLKLGRCSFTKRLIKAKVRVERMVKNWTPHFSVLVSHCNKANRRNHWILTTQQVSERSKNCTNRLEVLKTLEKCLNKCKNEVVALYECWCDNLLRWTD